MKKASTPSDPTPTICFTSNTSAIKIYNWNIQNVLYTKPLHIYTSVATITKLPTNQTLCHWAQSDIQWPEFKVLSF